MFRRLVTVILSFFAEPQTEQYLLYTFCTSRVGTLAVRYARFAAENRPFRGTIFIPIATLQLRWVY